MKSNAPTSQLIKVAQAKNHLRQRKLQDADRSQGLCCDKAVGSSGNRFEMIIAAAARARELGKGSAPKVSCSRGNIITALMEIEAGVTTGRLFVPMPTESTVSLP